MSKIAFLAAFSDAIHRMLTESAARTDTASGQGRAASPPSPAR